MFSLVLGNFSPWGQQQNSAWVSGILLVYYPAVCEYISGSLIYFFHVWDSGFMFIEPSLLKDLWWIWNNIVAVCYDGREKKGTSGQAFFFFIYLVSEAIGIWTETLFAVLSLNPAKMQLGWNSYSVPLSFPFLCYQGRLDNYHSTLNFF